MKIIPETQIAVLGLSTIGLKIQIANLGLSFAPFAGFSIGREMQIAILGLFSPRFASILVGLEMQIAVLGLSALESLPSIGGETRKDSPGKGKGAKDRDR